MYVTQEWINSVQYQCHLWGDTIVYSSIWHAGCIDTLIIVCTCTSCTGRLRCGYKIWVFPYWVIWKAEIYWCIIYHKYINLFKKLFLLFILFFQYVNFWMIFCEWLNRYLRCLPRFSHTSDLPPCREQLWDKSISHGFHDLQLCTLYLAWLKCLKV